MDNTFVNEFENDLRRIETELENLGRRICSVREGGPSWQHINRAISEVQRAYYDAHMMRD